MSPSNRTPPDPAPRRVRGRFAPSPTGPLHLGSLVAALGSYLHARKAGGEWLLRMEDLDPPREQPGAQDAILRSLDAHGLHWDGPVLRQSTRLAAYQAALDELVARGLAYPCRCSRRQLREQAPRGPYGPVYPGTCRPERRPAPGPRPAWRVRTNDRPIRFRDLRCGWQEQRLESELGDFVVRRADGLFAYQLAVVVDDAAQGVTEVVRGADLLSNTPRQIHLQRCLGLPTPRYLHLPLVRNAQGQKLSKQTHAPPLDDRQAGENLWQALAFLGLRPPAPLRGAPAAELLEWGVENWSVDQLPACRSSETA